MPDIVATFLQPTHRRHVQYIYFSAQPITLFGSVEQSYPSSRCTYWKWLHSTTSMKNALHTLMLSLIIGLASCALNPAWILSYSPTDWDEARGKRPDTSKNRAHYFSWYSKLIEREASGESLPWPTVWKGIFEGLDQGNDNANLYQSYIIQERRKHGLPALNF